MPIRTSKPHLVMLDFTFISDLYFLLFCFILFDVLLPFLMPRIGTKLFNKKQTVVRIRDVDPGSEFSILDPESKRFRIPDPDPHQRIKVLFLTQKLFISSRKHDPGC